MLNELDIDDKIKILTHRLIFWSQRINESTESIGFLNILGDQVKIDMNAQDILDRQLIIIALQQELDSLSV